MSAISIDSFASRPPEVREIRIHVDDFDLETGSAVLGGQSARHAGKVLRLQPGDPLTLFDGRGRVAAAVISHVKKDAVEVTVSRVWEASPESPLFITLAIALVRGEQMDLVVQKATELGVSRIQPVRSERSVLRLSAERAVRRLQHWRRVAGGACEQCGRNLLPEIGEVVELRQWLAALGPSPATDLRLLADLSAGTQTRLQTPAPRSVTLLVGPEGGFSEAEIALARECGFESIRFGPRVLRTATAAIAAVGILQWRFGDLGGG